MSPDNLNTTTEIQDMSDVHEAASAPVSTGSSDSPSDVVAPKKRTTRRTRKTVDDASVDAAAAPSSDTASTASESAVSAPPKRRPGRPRKNSAQVSDTKEASPSEELSAQASAKNSHKSTSSSSKSDSAEAFETTQTSGEPAQMSIEDAAVSAEQPKRRPGRPRKSVSVPATKEEVPPESSEQGAVETASSDSSEDKGEKRERSSRQSHEEQKGDVSSKSDRHERRSRQSQRDHRASGKQQSAKQTGQQNRSDQHQQRRQRRVHNGREPIAPKTNKEELAKLKVAELRAKASELALDVTGLKKAELVDKVYEASVRAEGFVEVRGILDTLQDGYGFLRTKGYLPSESDVYVSLATIRRNNLRKSDWVVGQTRPKRDNEKYAALQQVSTVNDVPIDELGQRVRFGDLTPVFPDECLTMEHGRSTVTARVIDLVSPIGKGQRGLIVSPPKAGKTTVLKDIAAAITANNPEVHLMCLLVDERPEEVTDMQRSIKGEVIASTFDMPTENHIAVSELVIERAKRLVECGRDVVVLLDSLTRLARAYNLAQPASGRILSGGVDSTALYPPKRFLGAARNIEGGGSLTILASALIETGSKMDEVIFEEFKGTGNMELKLDRSLADRRVFPAIDPIASGTRREDLLLDPQEAPLIWAVRRILANMNNTERAMDMLIKSLKQTNNNQEFLLRTAKKAQTQRDAETLELS